MSGFSDNVKDFASEFEGKHGYSPRGPSGPSDGDDMKERVARLEGALTTIGMDLSFIKGRIEDAPTKDWINGKISGSTILVLTCMGVGFAALGVLIAAVALK